MGCASRTWTGPSSGRSRILSRYVGGSRITRRIRHHVETAADQGGSAAQPYLCQQPENWYDPRSLTMSGQRSTVIQAMVLVFMARVAGVMAMAVWPPGPGWTVAPRGSNNHRRQTSWWMWWTAFMGSSPGGCIFFCFFTAGPWRSSVCTWSSTLSSIVESCDLAVATAFLFFCRRALWCASLLRSIPCTRNRL